MIDFRIGNVIQYQCLYGDRKIVDGIITDIKTGVKSFPFFTQLLPGTTTLYTIEWQDDGVKIEYDYDEMLCFINGSPYGDFLERIEERMA